MSRNESEYGRSNQPEKASLEALRTKQSNRLIELGFHKALGLSEEEYRNSLPTFEPQPKEYKGVFDLQVLVDPRVGRKEQHKMVNVKEFAAAEDFVDLTPTPDVPYVIWTHDAGRYRKQNVKQALERFAENEVASTQIEVTALFLQHPEAFEGHAVYAAGSRSDRFVPYLHGSMDPSQYYKRPRLGRGETTDREHSLWGTLSRGEKITTSQ